MVARAIIASNMPGSCCISHILRLLGKHLVINNEEYAGKYPQDVDMAENLERILDAKQRRQPMPEELTMDDLVNEDNMCSK
jgi:hypothetical protein